MNKIKLIFFILLASHLALLIGCKYFDFSPIENGEEGSGDWFSRDSSYTFSQDSMSVRRTPLGEEELSGQWYGSKDGTRDRVPHSIYTEPIIIDSSLDMGIVSDSLKKQDETKVMVFDTTTGGIWRVFYYREQSREEEIK